MKISNFFLILFTIFSIIAIMLSCNKDEAKNKNRTLDVRTAIQPVVENGTLKFSSKQEAFTYMETLTAILKAGKNGTDSTDNFINPAVDLSNSLRSSLGYTSLFESSPKDADGNMINSIFPDVAFNLMLNPNYEIIIGDRLYVHKNIFEHYHISKTDNVNKAILRNIAPGQRFDIKYLNPDIVLVGPTVETRTPCNCTFELRRSKNSNFTTHEYILRYWCPDAIDGQQWTMTWTSSDGLYTETLRGVINKSDATQQSIHPRDIVFKVPFKVGDYKIKFCVRTDCGDGLKEHCFDIPFSINDECCSNTEIDVPDRFVMFQSEGYRLVATYKNGCNFWGYYHYGHLAFVRLSDGKKLKAKKLELSFDVTNRFGPNGFPPCSPISETDYDDCTNCKWISENVYADNDFAIHHKRNDVKVTYKGTRGTTSGTLQIIPEFCY